ncbi:MAG TPA: RNA polymerase subunit sigma-70, partial [Planctomycetes bacterium]|nr:RNA polymerase subunit sigma-70 [Planctomycetota bacterium]
MNSYSSPLDDFEEDPAQSNTTENSSFQNSATGSTDSKTATPSSTHTEIVEETTTVDQQESWSDDPVRMYLTQMGEIPLLTRV